MFGPLFLLFVLVPITEMWLLIKAGGVFGAMPTIGAVLFTGVLGAALARREGILALTRITKASGRGELPTGAMFDGMAVFLGGALLLTPGFLTDAFGFALLFPYTRGILRGQCLSWLERRIREGHVMVHRGDFGQGFDRTGGTTGSVEDPQIYDATFEEEPGNSRGGFKDRS